jgi:hypothetical protein
LELNEKYDDVLFNFEDLIADFEEVNLKFCGDNTMIELRNNILRAISTNRNQLSQKAFNLYEEAIKSIYEYRRLFPDPSKASESSDMLIKVDRRNKIELAKKQIEDFSNDIQVRTVSAQNELQLQVISNEMQNKFWIFDALLKEYQDA